MNVYFDDVLLQYVATDDNYCGCPDCQDPIGYGETEQDAINDLLDQTGE